MRGFSNYPFPQEWQIVHVAELEANYKQGKRSTRSPFCLKGGQEARGLIKVLGKGSIPFASEVSSMPSPQAQDKDRSRGGNGRNPGGGRLGGKA
jgi:hypothetical protein